ncbi:GntR family transcriptional regulator [Dactylosporangium sp. NPDC000244]|uniref:GntR family transcriptional regulator n=1 Tax=Dactylosporangium sp. NPDC000244 TaxID=3154365 RepID=UPI003316B543
MTIEGLPPLPDGRRTGHTGDRVRQVLQEAILESVLPPGAHLNADSLAKQLGVSHIPVREALRSLAADGWIEQRPHAGAFVRERSEHELADLFETRQLLESQSAALAAERRGPAQLAALDAMLAEQAATGDPVELARINARFHVLVAECSQNELMSGFVRVLSLRARFYFSTVAPHRAVSSLREHTALVDAIRRRDAAEAARIARAHVRSTGDDVLKTLKTLRDEA